MLNLEQIHKQELNEAFLRGYKSKEKELIQLLINNSQGKLGKSRRIVHFRNGIIQGIYPSAIEASNNLNYSQGNITSLANKKAKFSKSRNGDTFEYFK